MNKISDIQEIGIFNAKTHLSEVIQRVQNGNVFIITMRGKPVAQIQPYRKNVQSLRQTLASLREIRASVGDNVDIKSYVEAGRKY